MAENEALCCALCLSKNVSRVNGTHWKCRDCGDVMVLNAATPPSLIYAPPKERKASQK